MARRAPSPTSVQREAHRRKRRSAFIKFSPRSSSALGPRCPLVLPLFVAPLQEILGARGAQMRAAIHHHHLAIDVGGAVGNQEACEIGKFPMLAGAAKRIACRPALVTALGA